MKDSYRMNEGVAERVDWSRLLDDYLDLYMSQEGLDLDPEELKRYPEIPPASENEFLLAKKLVKQEIEEILNDEAQAL